MSEIFPAANERLVSTIAKAADHLCGAPDIGLVIVSESEPNIHTSQPPRLAEKSGGQIVIITHDGRNDPDGWTVFYSQFRQR